MDTTVTEVATARDAAAERTYDVYFITSARRIYLRNPNRGVTLGSDFIAWTFATKRDGAPFKNIAEVRLQSGGSWQTPVNLCEIVFADRYKLIVNNGNDAGFPTPEQRTHYRNFLGDLHARLAAHAATRTGAPIVFRAGYSAGRYSLLMTLAILMTVISIGVPLFGLLMTGEVRPFMLLIAGAFFIWPLWQMMQNNAPRAYDPLKLPDELVG